jgi:hypothetical protein
MSHEKNVFLSTLKDMERYAQYLVLSDPLHHKQVSRVLSQFLDGVQDDAAAIDYFVKLASTCYKIDIQKEANGAISERDFHIVCKQVKARVVPMDPLMPHRFFLKDTEKHQKRGSMSFFQKIEAGIQHFAARLKK